MGLNNFIKYRSMDYFALDLLLSLAILIVFAKRQGGRQALPNFRLSYSQIQYPEVRKLNP